MLDHDLDAYYKISRAFADGQASGGLTRDHIPDNITVYWLTGTGGVGGPVVLGEETSPSSCGRAGSPGDLAPGQLHHVPG